MAHLREVSAPLVNLLKGHVEPFGERRVTAVDVHRKVDLRHERAPREVLGPRRRVGPWQMTVQHVLREEHEACDPAAGRMVWLERSDAGKEAGATRSHV